MTHLVSLHPQLRGFLWFHSVNFFVLCKLHDLQKQGRYAAQTFYKMYEWKTNCNNTCDYATTVQDKYGAELVGACLERSNIIRVYKFPTGGII